MSNLSQLNSPKSLSAPGGSFQLSSGVAPGPTCHKLAINVTTASAVSIVKLDGTTVSLGTMPVGFFVIDCQFQSVTFTSATAVGFYRIDG
jgi:hypothetical protein